MYLNALGATLALIDVRMGTHLHVPSFPQDRFLTACRMASHIDPQRYQLNDDKEQCYAMVALAPAGILRKALPEVFLLHRHRREGGHDSSLVVAVRSAGLRTFFGRGCQFGGFGKAVGLSICGNDWYQIVL